MDTLDEKDIEFAKKWQTEMAKAKLDCTEETLARMKAELPILYGLRDALAKEDLSLDEMPILLHNIISLVPEEQHRFLDNLIGIFGLLKDNVKANPDINYAIERLASFESKTLESKMQTTDLSMYWTLYRSALYKYGEWENCKQRKIQKRMYDKMVRIVRDTIGKRERGINTAEKMLKSK